MGPIDNEKRNLLVFGYGLALIGVVFGVGGFLKHGLTWAQYVLIGCSIVFWGVTALQWQALRLAYKFWMRGAHAIGYVVTTLILGVLFFVIFMPVGILLKVLGKDHLKRKIDPAVQSYWITRPEVAFEKERYHQQF